MSYSLLLYNPVLRGNAYQGDITRRVPDWRRSIDDTHGFRQAQGSISDPLNKLQWFFLNGLMWEIVEKSAGKITWQGFIAEIELEIGEDTWTRSIVDCVNAVKAIYTKIGDSQFTNGSAETAAWTAVGTPSTHERSTAWYSHHTYSMHIVVDAAGEGSQIENSASPETITVTAGLAYQCRVTVNVVSGSWFIDIRKTGSGLLASTAIQASGKSVVVCNIGVENAYTGPVQVRLRAAAAGAEIYADAAVFQLSPYQAGTEWLTNSDAITNYGRKEHILVMGGQTDDSALAQAQKYLNTHAWPMTRPPRRSDITQTMREVEKFQFGRREQIVQPQATLKFKALGYWATLGWRYTTSYGTQTISTWLNDLVGLQTDYLSTGIIDTNSVDYQVEENIPMTLLDAVREAIAVGDASGNRWIGGVGASRQFNYEQHAGTVDYHYQKDNVYSGGSLVDPVSIQPGLYKHDDMPIHPGVVSTNDEDDPRNIWVSQVEYSTDKNRARLYRDVDDEG